MVRRTLTDTVRHKFHFRRPILHCHRDSCNLQEIQIILPISKTNGLFCPNPCFLTDHPHRSSLITAIRHEFIKPCPIPAIRLNHPAGAKPAPQLLKSVLTSPITDLMNRLQTGIAGTQIILADNLPIRHCLRFLLRRHALPFSGICHGKHPCSAPIHIDLPAVLQADPLAPRLPGHSHAAIGLFFRERLLPEHPAAQSNVGSASGYHAIQFQLHHIVVDGSQASSCTYAHGNSLHPQFLQCLHGTFGKPVPLIPKRPVNVEKRHLYHLLASFCFRL